MRKQLITSGCVAGLTSFRSLSAGVHHRIKPPKIIRTHAAHVVAVAHDDLNCPAYESRLTRAEEPRSDHDRHEPEGRGPESRGASRTRRERRARGPKSRGPEYARREASSKRESLSTKVGRRE